MGLAPLLWFALLAPPRDVPLVRLDGRAVVAPIAEAVGELAAGSLTANGAAILEAEVGRLLALPEGFRFALVRDCAARPEPRRCLGDHADGAWMLLGRLLHPELPSGSLRCNVTTDLDWLLVDGLLCVGDEPSSEFAREQAASRSYHRPAALEPALAALLATLRDLRERGIRPEHASLDNGETTGPRPTVRVNLGLVLPDDGTPRTLPPHQVHGFAPLPADAARPAQAPRRRRKPGSTAPAVGEALERLVGLHDELRVLPGGLYLAFHAGDGSAQVVLECGPPGGRPTRVWGGAFPPAPADGEAATVHLGPVEVRTRDLAALLRECLARGSVSDEELAFLAAFAATEACGARLVAVTTPADAHPFSAPSARVLEVDLTAPEPFAALATRAARGTRVTGSRYGPRLIVLLDGDRRLDLSMEFGMCGVGLEPPTARLDGRRGPIVGGTALRAGPRQP